MELRCILLPGMDGSGLLFEPLKKLLAPSANIQIIPLSQSSDQSILNETKRIKTFFNSAPTIIVAESYSGRIAYELAKDNSLNIVHIVFVASFVSRPSFISKLAGKLPLSPVKKQLIPNLFLHWLLFGRKVDKHTMDLFYASINSVDTTILKKRLHNIACLDSPTEPLAIEATYIRPESDYLIGCRAITIIRQLLSDLKVITLPGGHFIAQSNPQGCHTVIIDLIKRHSLKGG